MKMNKKSLYIFYFAQLLGTNHANIEEERCKWSQNAV